LNIFERDTDWISLDNRRDRKTSQVTAESVYNRYSAQLPEWLVKDQTVLDLGSCLAAAAHWVLTQGATSYTGVEIQEPYITTSRQLLKKYWPQADADIVHMEIEQFLDQAIARDQQWDIVIAAGILYAFLDVFGLLAKIARVTRVCVTVDTTPGYTSPLGVIVMMPQVPINYTQGTQAFHGLGSNVNLKALDNIMGINSFARKEDTIMPVRCLQSHDSYHDVIEYPGGGQGPARYMTRYFRTDVRLPILRDLVVAQDKKAIFPNPNRVIVSKEPTVKWSFDPAVAQRFQQEARDHIPDYERVIELCRSIADQRCAPGNPIVDVGSALGHTLDVFSAAGYTNLYGVESSPFMLESSTFKDRIFLTEQFPDAVFKFVMINWTLHFILEKAEYLRRVYDHMIPGGTLIISDKTTQTSEVKELYYNFKRANGVAEEYIQAKEQKLKGYMHTVNQDWYADNLVKIGFTNVQIINARLGFVTFLCHKP
jgi:hypothetical protein